MRSSSRVKNLLPKMHIIVLIKQTKEVKLFVHTVPLTFSCPTLFLVLRCWSCCGGGDHQLGESESSILTCHRYPVHNTTCTTTDQDDRYRQTDRQTPTHIRRQTDGQTHTHATLYRYLQYFNDLVSNHERSQGFRQ